METNNNKLMKTLILSIVALITLGTAPAAPLTTPMLANYIGRYVDTYVITTALGVVPADLPVTLAANWLKDKKSVAFVVEPAVYAAQVAKFKAAMLPGDLIVNDVGNGIRIKRRFQVWPEIAGWVVLQTKAAKLPGLVTPIRHTVTVAAGSIAVTTNKSVVNVAGVTRISIPR